MPDTFSGKVAIVTGAASGIGAATARLLARGGAHVLAVDVNRVDVEALAGGTAGEVVAHIADLSQQEEAESIVAAAVDRWGGLDILINNAGIGSLAKVADLTPDDWRKVMAIDIDAVFYTCRMAMRHLVVRKGCVVNTASISGVGADYGFTAYNTAKAAVIGLTRVMAIDYAREGVRVNAVSPGYTDTALIAAMPQPLRDEFVSRVPMGRAGTAEEMADVIGFLASDRASYITGQNIVVDGGITAHTGQPDPIAFLTAYYAKR